MCIRDRFFEFPLDENAYKARNDTFMIGKSLLVAPVLQAGVRTVDVYLPNENWYDLLTMEQRAKYEPNKNQGQIYTLRATFEYINVLIRGCLLYTSPSPRDLSTSRMPSSA
eukprot:TRINITY_DN12227_c0_g1_i1.p3 TRINITY_DN12227_c0_g1~~TRINITY_DN12227_c0_g1_i1.p3  ORF type:complete len:124 (-),score=42.39 TRINITY_DN12227_c0_g1_i1:9-341(-)